MKTQRQAIVTTPNQLRQIANAREKELLELFVKLGKKRRRVDDIQFVLTIVNKDGLSDTWKFE